MLTLGLLVAVALSAETPAPTTGADAFVGRWNVRITDAENTFVGGWFQIEKAGTGLSGSLVWRSGSVVPATRTEVAAGTLHMQRETKTGADTFEATLDGAALRGQVRYADGKVHHFEGRRAPELTSTAAAPKWGAPVTLFDGKTLQGWSLRDPKAAMGWGAVGGELAVIEPEGNADLVSDRKFQDMKLHLEFNVEPKSNSGVYLRGRYEIQILDDPSKATEEHGCGALYSRIAPRVDANKPPGEWQSFDITLVGRRLTVVLNGTTVIDNANVDGITGGAIDPYEGEPGPLMLQGDHGKVRFRNVVVTPAE